MKGTKLTAEIRAGRLADTTFGKINDRPAGTRNAAVSSGCM